jgi:hypothetical protein
MPLEGGSTIIVDFFDARVEDVNVWEVVFEKGLTCKTTG